MTSFFLTLVAYCDLSTGAAPHSSDSGIYTEVADTV